MTVVTLYKDNKLDQASDYDPDEVVRQFVAAVEGGEFPTPGGGLDFAYRYWIANRRGLGSSWDEKDWPALMDALSRRVRADSELFGRLCAWAWGEDDSTREAVRKAAQGHYPDGSPHEDY